MTPLTLLFLLAILFLAAICGSTLLAIRTARNPTLGPRRLWLHAFGIAFAFAFLFAGVMGAIMLYNRLGSLDAINRSAAAGATITWLPSENIARDLAEVTIQTPTGPKSRTQAVSTYASILIAAILGQFVGTLFLLVPNILILKLVKPRPESRGFEISHLTPAPAPAAPSPPHHPPSQDASRSPSTTAAPPVAAGTRPASGS